MKINKIKKLKNILNPVFKKNFIIIAILSLVFLVFLRELNLFRNVYDIVKKDHHERAIIAYENQFYSGYCNKFSHGYLFYIDKKYHQAFRENGQDQFPFKR